MQKYGQFHDGFFEGFWIDGSRVHIYLSTSRKERFTALAEGVAALSAEGFRAGNIIFDVVTRDHDEITAEDICSLYDVAEGSVGEKQRLQLLDRARKESFVLLGISPSYGAGCLVLARSITFVRKPPQATDN